MKELIQFTLGLLLGVFGMWMYRYIRRYFHRRQVERALTKFDDALKQFGRTLMQVDQEMRGAAIPFPSCTNGPQCGCTNECKCGYDKVPFAGGRVTYERNQTLEEMLQQCLEEENYELAAVIRNKIEEKKK